MMDVRDLLIQSIRDGGDAVWAAKYYAQLQETTQAEKEEALLKLAEIFKPKAIKGGVMELIKRLMLSPFVLFRIVCMSIVITLGMFIMWLIDPTYDHEAAMAVNAEYFEFLRRKETK